MSPSAQALPIAWPILAVLLFEFVIWPILVAFLPNTPRCPICKRLFEWNDIDSFTKQGIRLPRPVAFRCPKCLETIGAPSWRKSFLLVSYLALVAVFMFVMFDLPGDLFWGYVGTLAAVVGILRIADWFIWRRLEPGAPSSLT
ncbi:MAG TPA: hypothetical protein VMH48_04290 [Methylomirabilota bacterium]|nr:hypothetical protein [Methylomirabilota bacterium]